MKKKAYLVLENEKIFEGTAFGASGTIVSEIVFATGMTGYLETLTDKSYFGQSVAQSFPLIGNYGVIPEDFESEKVQLSGYIVKHWCREPSNFRSEGNLNTFFLKQNIVGLCDIDTRALVKMIREQGTMNGMITDDLKNANMSEIKNYQVRNAVASVSTKERYSVLTQNMRFRVALMDFGLKENIIRELHARGCEVHVFPYNASADEILGIRPDGIMLSNGPGDPQDNPIVIDTLRTLINAKVPIFGICLGHQLLALANGFKTMKLKYGHRGANQPVRDRDTGRVYITSQNHGYAVVSDSIDQTLAIERFCNVNDGSCEGITYHNMPAFTVQFHPEACAGPQDTNELFGQFINLMEVQ